MVRKRSRKYYEEEDNDTDSDFAADNPPEEPVKKKYSLRQRKRPLFTEDFDYDVEEEQEAVPPKPVSDDEDFELELNEAADSEVVSNSTFINHYEPEVNTVTQAADELIDFEDIIRADIVVNKNRIDYDNVIQKTEIKIQPTKRGRKPKTVKVSNNDVKVEDKENGKKDKKVEEEVNEGDERDPIDCTKLLETQLGENDNSVSSDDLPLATAKKQNNLKKKPVSENNLWQTEFSDSVKTREKMKAEGIIDKSISEAVPITNIVNEDLNDDNFEEGENLENPKQEVEADDDVVVLEEKCVNDVIVLDDD